MNVTDLTGDYAEAAWDSAVVIPSSAAPELDVAKYRAHVAEFDLTEEQTAELLETLWSIMRSFVELGFSVDVCGQVFDGLDLNGGPSSDDVA